MKQTELMLLYSYIYNTRVSMEDEIHQLQNNIRFRKIDISDCVELACAIQRYDTFIETTNNIRTLLNLK